MRPRLARQMERARAAVRARTPARPGGGDRDRPNLLVVTADQQRWDALGCVGGWVRTPHLDRIAAEGVRFSQAFTNSPVCVPARASLATGRYPHETGVWKNEQFSLPARSLTWMRAIHEAGYRTSVIGKTHLHPQRGGDLRNREALVRSWGFDHVDEIAGPKAAARCRSHLTDLWEQAGVYEAYKQDLRERYSGRPWVVRPSPLPLELYPDVYVGRQAAAHLRSLSDDAPWMCCVGFSGPHEPFDTPEPYASLYDPAAMPAPTVAADGHQSRPRGNLDRRIEHRRDLTPDEIARLRADYAANITLIDEQIGGLLAVIEERGELDNTVVTFVSDHGEMAGDQGLLYKKVFLDSAARVPFLVRPPAGYTGERGVTRSTMVELMDLGATLLEFAGARAVPDSHARSVVPSLADGAREHRPHALSELSQEAMIATADWKLVVNRGHQPYLLYHRTADPGETRNLAGDPQYADVERDLARRLPRGLRPRG